jgi:hypothetical protein
MYASIDSAAELAGYAVAIRDLKGQARGDAARK